MNPDWTKDIPQWPQPMKDQLKDAISDHITGQPRFANISINDIQCAGSRYYGGFKNGNQLNELVSDLDIQIYVQMIVKKCWIKVKHCSNTFEITGFQFIEINS